MASNVFSLYQYNVCGHHKYEGYLSLGTPETTVLGAKERLIQLYLTRSVVKTMLHTPKATSHIVYQRHNTRLTIVRKDPVNSFIHT